MKKFALLFIIALNIAVCEEPMKEAYTVVVLLEAKAGKESALKSALQEIAEQSRLETSNIDYRLHQDTNEPSKFALYEKWASPELHQEQFDKPYIKKFLDVADDLLAGPYQAIFGWEF